VGGTEAVEEWTSRSEEEGQQERGKARMKARREAGEKVGSGKAGKRGRAVEAQARICLVAEAWKARRIAETEGIN
jgi:hypothetical protein